MVAGDLVNTASRIQSAAEPGTVLVGEATKRATEAAIAYEPAVRARAEGQGRARAALPRAPGHGGPRRRAEVGRSRAAVRRPRARAAPRQGALPRLRGGGQGAPRLGHRHRRDRQVAPRLGVREVRRRAGRTRSGGTGAAASPTGTASRTGRWPRWCGCGPDPRGGGARAGARQAPSVDRGARGRPGGARLARAAARPPARPRGADGSRPRGPLLGLAALLRAARRGRAGACSCSRTCSGPTRACSTSSSTCSSGRAHHPMFVLALARPELADRRPGFGAGGRNATTLSLEPLSERAMEQLLDGFVPGLPEELRGQILARSEGVPLYAVETVRMLLDRGLLAREGDVYRPTGAIEALDVPETLQALVAARLDGLAPEERRLASGRVRARQVVHEGRAGDALGRGRGRPRAAARLARPQGGAVRPGRSALARARPVQLPPGPAQAGRVRDAGEGRAQGAPPRRGRAPRAGVRRGRAGDRRGDRRALPRRLPRGAGRRRRARDQGQGAGDAHACR